MTAQQITTWDEIRRLADELDVKIHLAGMDARDRWHELQPRLAELEKTLEHSGERVVDTVEHELGEVRTALRALRDEVYEHARSNYVHGW